MKSNPKETSIVGIGEMYRGYTLKAILKNGVSFYKNGSNFILSLKKVKDADNKISKYKRKASSVNKSSSVSRSDISYYAKNPKQIWRDISIEELRDAKELKGFKVTKINPNSRFAKLGLQKGDIIIKANNIRLRSYMDALKIYNELDKLDVVQIVVQRKNKAVELVYEIN
jgi:general secretion pathway protein C